MKREARRTCIFALSPPPLPPLCLALVAPLPSPLSAGPRLSRPPPAGLPAAILPLLGPSLLARASLDRLPRGCLPPFTPLLGSSLLARASLDRLPRGCLPPFTPLLGPSLLVRMPPSRGPLLGPPATARAPAAASAPPPALPPPWPASPQVGSPSSPASTLAVVPELVWMWKEVRTFFARVIYRSSRDIVGRHTSEPIE